MSKVWIGAALAAAAVGAGVGYALVRAKTPDFGPAGPNRDLAPESLACYAEVGDGAGLWTKMQGTEAWSDLAVSKLAASVTEAGPVKEFLAALDQVAAKAKYRIDAKNAMKLVGREVSVGVKLDPAGGVPQVLVLTKLDTAALAKDLLSGGTDLDALWAEMQRRTGNLDFKVTASEHRGHKMATAARGETSYHAALLGDTLAVATDAALVRAVIDCRIDGGAKSIGRRDAFQADMKALPAGASILEWYDLDALDAGRASLDAGLARFSGSAALPGAVHAILDGTKGAHSLGRATSLPDGDLYRLSWSYSKSSELFADRISPQIAGLLDGDWAVYVEAREIGAVAEAWKRSSLRKNLAAGEIGKWLDGVMDDPAKTFGGASHLFGRAVPFAAAVGEDDMEENPAPKEKGPAALLGEFGDRFTVTMGKHLLGQWLAALTKGEGALAGSFPDGFENPRFASAVRLDTEGRLLALAVQGAVQGEEGPSIKSELVGSRRVWSISGKVDSHWVFAGDTLVIANDLELVTRAAKSDGSAPASPGRIAQRVARLKPGWRALVSYDLNLLLRGVSSAMERRGGGRSQMPMFDQLVDVYREAGVYGNCGEVALYVPDDFSAIEVRSRVELAAAATEEGRLLRTESADMREPRCWASLPESTIVHASAPAAGVRTLWMVAKGLATLVGAKMESVESGFRDAMGMDLEKELIPALGREVFFAVTFKAAPPGPANPDTPSSQQDMPSPQPMDAPVVVPGIVLGIEVKDPAVVKKALDRAIELADEAIRESPNAPPQSPFVREAREGVEIVRLEMPTERIPLEPACALHDGFLVVTSDAATLRACVDVRMGKMPRLADTPRFSAAAGELGRKCANFMLLDWDRLADQVAVYAPMIGQGVAGADVPYPEFPDNGDQEEWRRRVAEYQKKMAEGRGAGEAKVRRWIDAFRVIDYVGQTGTSTSDAAESATVVRFKK